MINVFLCFVFAVEGFGQQADPSVSAESIDRESGLGAANYVYMFSYDHGLRIRVSQNEGSLQVFSSDREVDHRMIGFQRKDQLISFSVAKKSKHLWWLSPLVEVKDHKHNMLVPLIFLRAFCTEYSKDQSTAIRRYAFVDKLHQTESTQDTELQLPSQYQVLQNVSTHDNGILDVYMDTGRSNGTGDQTGRR